MHSIVTTSRGADIKVEVANFCAAMDTLIDQDVNNQYVWSTITQVLARQVVSNLFKLIMCNLKLSSAK